MAAPFRAIGIVGMGFVGRAVAEHFKRYFHVYGYDSMDCGTRLIWDGTAWHDDATAVVDIDRHWAAWLTSHVDGPIFICVPTPPAPDGRCDTSIVEEVLAHLDFHSIPTYRNVVIIKSTIPPGTTDRLNLPSMSEKFSVVHNPEFLTERTAVWDFAHQREVIIGGPVAARNLVREMYLQAFPDAAVLCCLAIEAEMVKYTRNAFYAVKLAYANEIYALCQRMGIDYEAIHALNMCHPWMGGMHWKVPGHDGQVGFGGKCLPKDLAALIHLCQEQGVNCDTMLGAFTSNKIRRPDDEQPAVRGPYRSPC